MVENGVDLIAGAGHDVDDAVRAGILRDEDVPEDVRRALGDRYSVRIDTLVKNVIENGYIDSLGNPVTIEDKYDEVTGLYIHTELKGTFFFDPIHF